MKKILVQDGFVFFGHSNPADNATVTIAGTLNISPPGGSSVSFPITSPSTGQFLIATSSSELGYGSLPFATTSDAGTIIVGSGLAITDGVLSATGGGSGVSQIVAGTNVTISPSGGTGVVTINASGGTGSSLTINAQTGNYTAVLSDANVKYINMQATTAVATLTIPPSTSAGGTVAWVSGMTLEGGTDESGHSVSIAGGTNVLIHHNGTASTPGPTSLRGNNSPFGLIYKGYDGTNDNWQCFGDLT
jgi:hypothetical protein